MSKLHVIAGGNGYPVYIHTNMPAGVNSVSNSWKACYVSAYAPVSKMTIGTGVGQISSSEAASIVAGDVLEFQAAVAVAADGSVPSSSALSVFADSIISTGFVDLQVHLKYFGYTQ